MSQTLLYHAFGIKGVTYRNTQVLGNALIFSVETTSHHLSNLRVSVLPFQREEHPMAPDAADRSEAGCVTGKNPPVAMCPVQKSLVAPVAVCPRQHPLYQVIRHHRA